jgi:hypothetical protein
VRDVAIDFTSTGNATMVGRTIAQLYVYDAIPTTAAFGRGLDNCVQDIQNATAPGRERVDALSAFWDGVASGFKAHGITCNTLMHFKILDMFKEQIRAAYDRS